MAILYQNLFDLDPAEQRKAQEMKFRTDLMLVLTGYIHARHLSIDEAATLIGFDTEQISAILALNTEAIDSTHLLEAVKRLGLGGNLPIGQQH